MIVVCWAPACVFPVLTLMGGTMQPASLLWQPAIIGGLYLASGSAHPGGGVPLCAQSGLLAAQAALFDLGICEGGLDNTYSKAIH